MFTGFTGFHRVLPGFTRFYRVLPGFTGFYRGFRARRSQPNKAIKIYIGRIGRASFDRLVLVTGSSRESIDKNIKQKQRWLKPASSTASSFVFYWPTTEGNRSYLKDDASISNPEETR